MISKIPQLPRSAITPEALFWDRRRFMQLAAGSLASLAAPACLSRAPEPEPTATARTTRDGHVDYADGEALNSFEDITSYNNFYEFGTGKSDPARYAHTLELKPWTLRVDGECEAGGDFDLHQLIATLPSEERIYRLRCVEGWSMVIPWRGFELGPFLQRFAPTDKARYVAFETAVKPKQMRLNASGIDWPYREGLRMDEAMNPLSFMATGLYDKPLPRQNGAPMRLVVPWKYGFKSIKSIVRFTFTSQRPVSFWEEINPQEYGFWANVNPEVPHPRWSQASEEVLGTGKRVPTQLFNGYGEYVAGLYKGMQDKPIYF